MTVDLAQLFVAMGSVLTLFGGAFAWLFRMVQNYKRETDAKLERCEAHHQVSDHRKMSQAGIIRFLIDAWRQADPHNPLLKQAEAMLNEMERQAAELAARFGLPAPPPPKKEED